MERLLWGRELLVEELPNNFFAEIKPRDIKERSGWFVKNGRYYCRRCGSIVQVMTPNFCTCKKPCGYCRNCVQMGRVKKCSTLYSLSVPKTLTCKKTHELSWDGKLSEQQQIASEAIVEAIKDKEKRLLYAVAGAGKTEMLFEGIYTALNRGERVCIASPRIDVCLELAPRLQAAFSSTEIAVLYGDMPRPYRFTPLVIATTHQLLRFNKGFDVLIIDEVDAFPYHRDEVLAYGANKCVKKNHALIYLTATPSKELKKKFKKEEVLTLPARYHGYALPEPQAVWSGEWKRSLLKKKSTKTHKIIKQIQCWIQKGRRFLVFCPEIQWMERFEDYLHSVFKEVKFTSVSSKDELRKEKVMNMRKGEYQFLLTTTILERGVTFSNIDVMVIGAEDNLFDEAALIQIAGRAGRSYKYPTGTVIFYHNGRTRALNSAISSIRTLNRMARKRGLLCE